MKRLLFILLFLITGRMLEASVPVYRMVQIDPGKPELRINTIYQDHQGFIWIGTDQGLYRYDGFRFDRAILDTTTANQSVTCLAEDALGFLYAGLADGKILKRKNDWSEFSHPFRSPLRSLVFTNGIMWAASYGEGIRYLKNNSWKQAPLVDNSIYQMVLHPTGKLIAGTDLGLMVIDPARPAAALHLEQEDGLPDNIVRSIYCGTGDKVILGTEEKGICEFSLRDQTFTVPGVSLNWNHGAVNAIALLPNEYWIGTGSSGIIDYEFAGERRVRAFNRNNGFPFSSVNVILNDRQGNLWVAADNKLLLSPGEKTEFITEAGTTLFRDIGAVTSDDKGYIWFSTENRICRYSSNDNSVSKWLTDAQYRNLHPTSLAASSAGIWIGTFDNGLFLLDTVSGKARRFDEKSGLLNPNVISIAVRNDSVWLATLGGIALGVGDDNGGYRFIDFSSEGPGRGFVYCVHAGKNGEIWFGTDGKGLVVYENGKFRSVSLQNEKTRVIYSVVADRTGKVWFSTPQSGVYRYDGKSLRSFGLSEGVREQEISSLSMDNSGHVVVIHAKGIDLIDPENFSIHPIGADAGIEAIEPGLNAVTRDAIGNVWIGTAKGLLRFYNYDKPGGYEPMVIIRRLFTYLNPAGNTRDTIFRHDENQISIEYIGLYYGNPESVRYQYRLKGYNSAWITTRDRVVTFPNLPPGRYVFEVRATRNSEFSHAALTSLAFRIQPPFWKTWWFLLVSIVVLVTIVLLVIRARTKRLRKLDLLEKERISYQYETLRSQVNPHFLFNSFNTLISIIEEDQQKAVEFAEKLSDYFRHMVQYRDREIIPLASELELVETYYYLQQQRFGDYLTVTISIPEVWKHQFGVPPLSLQLLIENAVKHNAVSHETPLHITVTGKDEDRLVIRNNLNAKSNPDRSTGIGLENIVHRFGIITNHKIEIRKTATHFEVELPLIKTAVYERADY